MVDDAQQKYAEGIKGEADFSAGANFIHTVVYYPQHIQHCQQEGAPAD